MTFEKLVLRTLATITIMVFSLLSEKHKDILEVRKDRLIGDIDLWLECHG